MKYSFRTYYTNCAFDLTNIKETDSDLPLKWLCENHCNDLQIENLINNTFMSKNIIGILRWNLIIYLHNTEIIILYFYYNHYYTEYLNPKKKSLN